MVAIMTFSTKLQVLQDFTDDRDRLAEVINGFRIGEASELAADGRHRRRRDGEDTGAAFTADESEFNIFNTDRKLAALESAAKMLGRLPEKKALVYFSSGVGKTGVENQSQLRATINAAVRANVAFYPDRRARPGGHGAGGRRHAGLAARQRHLLRRRAAPAQRDSFQDQQETLVHAGRRHRRQGAARQQRPRARHRRRRRRTSRATTSSATTAPTPALDGRYRRIEVQLENAACSAKLDYRSGYFAAKEFRQFNALRQGAPASRKRCMLGDPITDLPLALEVNYFRLARDRYFVPVAVKIPGSEIELARKGGAEKTPRSISSARCATRKGGSPAACATSIKVKLKGDTPGQLDRRKLQYDTGFTLPPGDYTLKFLARENETGKMGTFETKFDRARPDRREDLPADQFRGVGNQREPLSAAVGAAGAEQELLANHPLVQEGQKLIPSITKVFRKDQNLYVFFEVYDPGRKQGTGSAALAVNMSVFRDGRKVFESDARRIGANLEARSGSLPVDLEIPLDQIGAGEYICQLNVMDEAGRKFAFRRSPLIVLP